LTTFQFYRVFYLLLLIFFLLFRPGTRTPALDW